MLRSSLYAVALLSLAGCATIIHGTSQDVGFSSTPSAATVSVDNVEVGKTPVITKLSRKDNHIIKVQLAGFQPFEATVTRSVSGWVVGNLVFGALPGLVIDAISGGLYKLTPEQVAAQMALQGASVTRGDHGLYVAVVLHPDSTWERVGSLQRASDTSAVGAR